MENKIFRTIRVKSFFSLNYIFGVVFLLFLSSQAFPQNTNFMASASQVPSIKAASHTTANPFKTNVFVKNQGQFNTWIKATNNPILFVVDNKDQIFFTPTSLIFKMRTVEKRDKEHEAKREDDDEHEEEEKRKIKTHYAHLEWLGSNKTVTVEEKNKVEGYYTYGESGYENIRANGYEQLLYRNLYEGIDVAYSIPSSDSNGIKYNITLHPESNHHLIKIQYTGDIEGINILPNGNAAIESAAGQIIDYAPTAFYIESGKPLEVRFKKDEKDNYVYFDFPEGIDNSKTVVIDPWIKTPTSLTNNNKAADVDYDDFGNIYVAGGIYPHKIAKYTGAGVPLWTYTMPNAAFSHYYSEFGIIRKSGSIYTGTGYGNPTPYVIKVNSLGAQVLNVSAGGTNNELWSLVYHPCLNKLLGFGGGTFNNPDNLYVFNDTLLTAPTTIVNSNQGIYNFNDIVDAVIDVNGDFFGVLGTGAKGNGHQNDHLYKSLQSNGYNPPTGFNVNSNNSFRETGVAPFGGATVRQNALAINSSYLFSYNGNKIKAWNKTSGTLLDSVIVNSTYIGGYTRKHEGIAVDECNNVYVGGFQAVHTYSFDGANFTFTGDITTNVPNEVYDVTLDPTRDLLYVCGDGFLSSTSITPCINLIDLTTTTTVTTPCSGGTGSATVNPSGGTPPYTYLWSNGDTTSTINNLSPGTYTVMVWDASCTRRTAIDTAIVNVGGNLQITSSQINPTCSTLGSATVTPQGGTPGYTYLWSPTGQTTPTASGLSPGVYNVNVIDNAGCSTSSKFNILNTTFSVNYTTSYTGCTGGNTGNISLTTAGGVGPFTYSWSNGQTASTATGLSAGTYTVTVTDANNCSQTHTITLDPFPIKIDVDQTSNCKDMAGITLITGGLQPYIYLWNTGATTLNITGAVAGNTYWATVTDAAGCTATDSVTIISKTDPAMNDFTWSPTPICAGVPTSFTPTGLISNTATYQWSIVPGTTIVSSTPDPISFTFPTVGTYKVYLNIQFRDLAFDCYVSSKLHTVTVTNCTTPCPNPPVLSTTSQTDETCSQANGSITVAVNGGTGTAPFTYNWSTGATNTGTSSTIPNLSANTYSVTVTDAKGCTTSSSITLVSPPPLLGQFTKGTANCTNCGCKEWLMVNAINGTPPYDYQWSDGYDKRYKNKVCPGNYTIKITDKNGCSVNVNVSTP